MKFNNNFYILRHGQTSYQLKKEKIIYPWPEKKPILLTKKGEETIKRVARKLKKIGVDLIFSSDIPRARQTTKIIRKILKFNKKKIFFDKRLRDINNGIFKGKKLKEYQNFFKSEKERFFKRPPKGESKKDCQERIFKFLKEIDQKFKNKNILIVSHGDPLWLLEGKIKEKNYKELFQEKKEKKTIKVGELRKLI